MFPRANYASLDWMSSGYKVRLLLLCYYKDNKSDCLMSLEQLFQMSSSTKTEEKQFRCHSIKIIPSCLLVVLIDQILLFWTNLNIRSSERSWPFVIVVYTLAVKCITTVWLICARTKFHVGFNYTVLPATAKALNKVWGTLCLRQRKST